MIDPVDLSNDSLKQGVKLVLQAVAQSEAAGSPDFTAKVFDDADTATADLSNDAHGDLAAAEGKAYRDQREQHLVAAYYGALPGLNPYDIMWYPGASTGSPNVGRYVATEDWKA